MIRLAGHALLACLVCALAVPALIEVALTRPGPRKRSPNQSACRRRANGARAAAEAAT